MLLTYRRIEDYANALKRRLVITKIDGAEVAQELIERDSALSRGVLAYLDERMRNGEISINEPYANQLLDFVEAVYKDLHTEEGAYFHRRNLEVRMHELAADKEAKAS